MAQIDRASFWESASLAFANDSLELTLLPTEQCNLRCTYCYERFELGRMSDQVVASVKELLRRRAPELRKLNIDWFGGEPLLAVDVIEDIGGFAKGLARGDPFLDFTSSITTNGIRLTPEVARRIEAVNVRNMHVSLDGPAEAHDITRKSRGGSGTFAKIEKNLRGIRSTPMDVRIQLRIHVTAANITLLDDFVDWLSETFLCDPRFSLYFFPIVDLGGPNRGGFPILDHAQAAAAVQRLTERVRRPVAAGEPATANAGCKSHYVCYAAKANAWVIRSDGRLAKCTVAFDDERNHVGQLLPDGSLQLRKPELDVWMRGWTTGDEMSLHCPNEGLRRDAQAAPARTTGGRVRFV
jgi:uncharacterized protein